MTTRTWVAYLVRVGLAGAIVFSSAVARLDVAAAPARPEFYKDVLPILQRHCQSCHRPSGLNLGGMVAPMALMSFDDARPWAKAIAKRVSERSMPPWHASNIHHGQFANERTLTDDEIAIVVQWAETGANRGNPKDGPAPLKFPDSEWSFGEPDLIVSLPERYFVDDDVRDRYVNFESRIGEALLSEPRYISASEVKPGSKAVHHVISTFGGLTPGMEPNIQREGFGQLIRPGQPVAWEMHYNKEAGPGTGLWDATKIGLKFYPKDWKPTYRAMPALLGNYTFRIPAGDPNYTCKAEFTFAQDARIMSYFPHMHLRGKEMKLVAYYPDGSEEILLHVPNYDFNWQTVYKYKEFKFVPKGTRLELTARYDNSAGNKNNPDPTVDVEGPKTPGAPMQTDQEMMYTLLYYTDALQIDNNTARR